jgi:hypothetical protein
MPRRWYEGMAEVWYLAGFVISWVRCYRGGQDVGNCAVDRRSEVVRSLLCDFTSRLDVILVVSEPGESFVVDGGANWLLGSDPFFVILSCNIVRHL